MDDLSQSDLIISNDLLNWETFITQPLFLSHKFKYPGGRDLFFCHKCDGRILQVQSDLYHLKVYSLSLGNMAQKWIKWISTTAYVFLKHRLSYKSGICFLHSSRLLENCRFPVWQTYFIILDINEKEKKACNTSAAVIQGKSTAGMGLSPRSTVDEQQRRNLTYRQSCI